MVDSNTNNNQGKMDFENLAEGGQGFVEESNEFAGEDVKVNYKIMLFIY
jgi:hypothetical protein